MTKTLHIIDLENLHGPSITNKETARARLEEYLAQAGFDRSRDFILFGHSREIVARTLSQILTDLNIDENNRLIVVPEKNRPQAVDISLHKFLTANLKSPGKLGQNGVVGFNSAVICSGDKDFVSHATLMRGAGLRVSFIIPEGKKVSRSLRWSSFPIQYWKVKDGQSSKRLVVAKSKSSLSLSFDSFSINVTFVSDFEKNESQTFLVPAKSKHVRDIKGGEFARTGVFLPESKETTPASVSFQDEKRLDLQRKSKSISSHIASQKQAISQAEKHLVVKERRLREADASLAAGRNEHRLRDAFLMSFSQELGDLAWASGESIDEILSRFEKETPKEDRAKQMLDSMVALLKEYKTSQVFSEPAVGDKRASTGSEKYSTRLSALRKQVKEFEKQDELERGALNDSATELRSAIDLLQSEIQSGKTQIAELQRELAEVAKEQSKFDSLILLSHGIVVHPGKSAVDVIREIHQKTQAQLFELSDEDLEAQLAENSSIAPLLRMLLSHYLVELGDGIKICCWKTKEQCKCDPVTSARLEIERKYNIDWKTWLSILSSRGKFCWPFFYESPINLARTLSSYTASRTLMSHFLDVMIYPQVSRSRRVLTARLNVPKSLSEDELRTMNSVLIESHGTSRSEIVQMLLENHAMFHGATSEDVMFWVASLNHWHGLSRAIDISLELARSTSHIESH